MIVLDANILVRAVLGWRVRQVLEANFLRIKFFAPDTVFAEAREHLPAILRKRGIDPRSALIVLEEISQFIACIDSDIYASKETAARLRLHRRDQNDWPVLASALALGCPIWTEDDDFFGTGVATWTTDRVELFLSDARENPDESNSG